MEPLPALRVLRSTGGPIAAAPNPLHAPGGKGSRHRWARAYSNSACLERLVLGRCSPQAPDHRPRWL